MAAANSPLIFAGGTLGSFCSFICFDRARRALAFSAVAAANTFTNNATEQGAGEGTDGVAITQTADNYAALVVDAAGGDFSITDTSSELYNAGTNTGAPPDDIIGILRPQDTTVDIGAFEFPVDGGPTEEDVAGSLPAMSGALTRKVSYHRSIGGAI